MISDLKDEWDEYKALSEGVDANTDVLSFFRDHQDSLPTFGEAAQLLAVMPSSSASAERVFSLLRSMFGNRTCPALEDRIELALMLAYNLRVVWGAIVIQISILILIQNWNYTNE